MVDHPVLVGLIDPTKSVDTHVVCAPVSSDISPLNVVWARLAGFKPLWTPAIVTYVYKDGECSVFFLSTFARVEEQEVGNVESGWLGEEESMRLLPTDKPTGKVQFAFIPYTDCCLWNSEGCCMLAEYEKTAGSQNTLKIANALFDKSMGVPAFIMKDHLYRSSVENHSVAQTQIVNKSVIPSLRLHHLKLFIECNLMELFWRTIAHARQFVKPVLDETYGGYHLIAAQNWPTDSDIAAGRATEVCLVYCGNILVHDEAIRCDSSNNDWNRYVAEIPNTCTIWDKSGTVNINHTGKNLYVNGLKYSDPNSSLWAPGPTVNHERTKYCKLEPHHVNDQSGMKGFWLQRKRGHTITKGEPLFWSYDGGAGKFDQDFNLANAPPPRGWIPTQDFKPAKRKATRNLEKPQKKHKKMQPHNGQKAANDIP